MPNLRLTFVSGSQIELIQTDYTDDVNSRIVSVRGKTAGAHRGAGTFQWTTAVKAMMSVLLRARLSGLDSSFDPVLTGDAGTPASSLDYALSKEPSWLGEMFGLLPNGRIFARRLFLVTNPNRKRPGPVAVALNTTLLHPEWIAIYLDGKKIEDCVTLSKMVGSLEQRHFQEEDTIRTAA